MGEYAIPFARRDHSSSSPPLGQNQRQRPSEGSFALQERVQKGAQMENLAHRKELEIWLPHVLQVTFPTSETPGSLLPPPLVSNTAPGKTSPCRPAGLPTTQGLAQNEYGGAVLCSRVQVTQCLFLMFSLFGAAPGTDLALWRDGTTAVRAGSRRDVHRVNPALDGAGHTGLTGASVWVSTVSNTALHPETRQGHMRSSPEIWLGLSVCLEVSQDTGPLQN